jgi:hypothetical protein
VMLGNSDGAQAVGTGDRRVMLEVLPELVVRLRSLFYIVPRSVHCVKETGYKNLTRLYHVYRARSDTLTRWRES